MSALIDLLGRKFGRLTVVATAPSAIRKNGKPMRRWECVCDCGSTVVVNGMDLRRSGTRSCGCFKRDRALPGKLGVYRKAIRAYRNNAREYGRTFDLSEAESITLFESPCFYCNTAAPIDGYQGIDRVDSDLSYTVDNCIACCFVCNRAKGRLTQQEFFAWVRQIYLALFPSD